MLAAYSLADLAVEANFALTLFIAVAVFLLWREVFPSLVRMERHVRRSEILRQEKTNDDKQKGTT